MNYTILFSPEASDDLTEILGYYKSQSSPDLQKRFITALSTALKTLQAHPKSFSIRFKNARCGVVKTFPYNIYYWVMMVSKILIYLLSFINRDILKFGKSVCSTPSVYQTTLQKTRCFCHSLPSLKVDNQNT